MNNFDDLYQRYLNGHISEKEQAELDELIASGKYDDRIRQKMTDTLLPEMAGMEISEADQQDILQDILKTDIHDAEVIPMYNRGHRHWWFAAAAVVAMAIVSTWLIVRGPVPDNTMALSQRDTVHHFSGRQFVELPDGSTAILNDGSTLTYFDSYGAHLREVTLTGEAYFKVSHDKLHAFVVRSGTISTEVLGTEFNVNAYPAKDVVVTVAQGKVQVYGGINKLDMITPAQQLSINTATHSFVKKAVAVETALAWKSEFLILNRVTMKEAADIISQKNNVHITLSTEALKKCRVTGRYMHNEKLNDILTAISGAVNATCKIKRDGSVTIEGEGCTDDEPI